MQLLNLIANIKSMGNRISIHSNHQAVLLYNSSRDKWEDKTDSISAIYEAYYYGNRTGYEVCYGSGSGNRKHR